MRTGAIAMIDALGFKGVWNRPEVKDDPERVIQKLKELRKATVLDGSGHDFRIEAPQAMFLSDTIVVSIAITPKNQPSDPEWTSNWTQDAKLGMALHQVALYVKTLMNRALSEQPKFAYRGCISVGRFDAQETFILGPAVDEAAELMDRAQGAFVWLAPSARRFSFPEGQAEPWLGLHRYAVPLKGGDDYVTHVVTPFEIVSSAEERQAVKRALLETFNGPSFDVELKRQNTEAFLESALEAAPWHEQRARR